MSSWIISHMKTGVAVLLITWTEQSEIGSSMLNMNLPSCCGVQEDNARLEVAVGHYYWVLTDYYTADIPYSILRKLFAEYYMFLLCIVVHSMLFPLPIPQVLDIHLLCCCVIYSCHVTIYTVLIFALLIFGLMPFGQLCTRLLLRVHNTHSVVQAWDGVFTVNCLSHHMLIVLITVIVWCICL